MGTKKNTAVQKGQPCRKTKTLKILHSCSHMELPKISRKKDPDEVLQFCDLFRMQNTQTPLVVVPTSFPAVTEEELAAHGVNIVIYANQLTRSAFPAMDRTAKSILRYHRAWEADRDLMPIPEIITLIDEI